MAVIHLTKGELMTITIDSRGCGQGKTTDITNGIYSRIQQHIALNSPVLIVVPSVKLQHQYRNAPELQNITVSVINSDVGNVSVRIHNELRKSEPRCIVITHEAFLRTPISGYHNNWHLIIDEVLDGVIKVMNITHNTSGVWQPNLDIDNLYTWRDSFSHEYYTLAPDDTDTWHELKSLRTPNETVFSDSPTWRQLTNPNYDLWVTAAGWRALRGETTVNTRIVLSLKPDVLQGWLSCHIAAAAFENTFMYQWLNYHKIGFTITNPFIPHVINVCYHSIIDSKWSNNKRRLYPEISKKFREYVVKHSNEPVLAFRNNSETGIIEHEVRAAHNAAGLNEYSHIWRVSIETALRPAPELYAFLVNKWDMNKPEILQAFAAYRFYQLIMRTGIRIQPIDMTRQLQIYIIDDEVGGLLQEYFDLPPGIQISQVTKTIAELPQMALRSAGRPKKSVEVKKQNRREYMKKYMSKKRKTKE